MFSFDFLAANPWDELQAACDRAPSDEYSSFPSLEGRKVCLRKIRSHAADAILKPVFYIGAGLIACVIGEFTARGFGSSGRFPLKKMGTYRILTGLAAPFGQIMQLFKAIMGILYPAFYFKKDGLQPYFTRLTKIAEELKCASELVDFFRKGPALARTSLNEEISVHYKALVKVNLEKICKKLEDSTLSDSGKLAILLMFTPLNESYKSGIKGCAGGFVGALERICASLDAPKEMEQ